MTNCKMLLLAPVISLCIGRGHAQDIPASDIHSTPAMQLPDLAADQQLSQRNLTLIAGEVLAVGWYGKKKWCQEGWPQNRVRKIADTVFEYVQVPGTAVFTWHTLPKD